MKQILLTATLGLICSFNHAQAFEKDPPVRGPKFRWLLLAAKSVSVSLVDGSTHIIGTVSPKSVKNILAKLRFQKQGRSSHSTIPEFSFYFKSDDNYEVVIDIPAKPSAIYSGRMMMADFSGTYDKMEYAYLSPESKRLLRHFVYDRFKSSKAWNF